MIKDKKLLEEFEEDLIKNSKIDIAKNLKLFQQLLDLARQLNKLPPQNLFEGIEIDIKYARAINGIKRTN